MFRRIESVDSLRGGIELTLTAGQDVLTLRRLKRPVRKQFELHQRHLHKPVQG